MFNRDPNIRQVEELEQIEHHITACIEAYARCLYQLDYREEKIKRIIDELCGDTHVRKDIDRCFDRFYYQKIVDLRARIVKELEEKIPIAEQVKVETVEFDVIEYRRRIRELLQKTGLSSDLVLRKLDSLLKDENDEYIMRLGDKERFTDSTPYTNKLLDLCSRLNREFHNLQIQFDRDLGYASN